MINELINSTKQSISWENDSQPDETPRLSRPRFITLVEWLLVHLKTNINPAEMLTVKAGGKEYIEQIQLLLSVSVWPTAVVGG
jgi:hypothetical protein